MHIASKELFPAGRVEAVQVMVCKSRLGTQPASEKTGFFILVPLKLEPPVSLTIHKASRDLVQWYSYNSGSLFPLILSTAHS